MRRDQPCHPAVPRPIVLSLTHAPLRADTGPGKIAAARERRRARERTPIVLAYGHRLLREALRALLEAERDLRIIGECDDGREVMRVVKRLAPRVLVLNFMMPGLSGLEVTQQVRDQVPTTSVVILSMHASELRGTS
jgi:PleD family two-component response regulator